MRLIDADRMKQNIFDDGGHETAAVLRTWVENQITIDAIPVEWLVNLKNEYAREWHEQAEGDLINLLLMWQKEQEGEK